MIKLKIEIILPFINLAVFVILFRKVRFYPLEVLYFVMKRFIKMRKALIDKAPVAKSG